MNIRRSRKNFLRCFARSTRLILISICLPLLMLFACTSQQVLTAQNPITSQYTSSSAPSAISNPSAVQPQTSEPAGNLLDITNVAFFDYNGNGIQDGGEYGLSGLTLTFQPGNISCVTDKNGQGKVEIAPGSYSVSISDPLNSFKYITFSSSEFTELANGMKVDIRKNQQILIPMAQGFLTWPFTSDTHVGVVWYFEPTHDPTQFCVDSTWIVEQYSGLYIGDARPGNNFVAAAPLKVVAYQPDQSIGKNGITGGVITVAYPNGWTGYYAHAKLLNGVKIGDFVPRGKAFASVENPGLGAFHAHLCLIETDNVSVDPYDYFTQSRLPHYPN